jgi:hypothetical protein
MFIDLNSLAVLKSKGNVIIFFQHSFANNAAPVGVKEILFVKHSAL